MSGSGADFVQRIFRNVSGTYEPINHIITLGLDIVWRRKAIATAVKAGGSRWADMCTGTGETAVYLSHLSAKGTIIYAVDFSLPMLKEAKKKQETADIVFVSSDIKKLPFPDNSLDLITMTFASRNINLTRDILVRSFAEFYRVLKPGGRFVNLDTSQPSLKPARKLLDLYVRLFVEFIGSRISGMRTPYAYLTKTILCFYPPEELADIIREAGFRETTFQKLFFGAAAVHQGIKQ
ncbi:MAG: ubiquinone/menaquinone biosynthesis methyltransferase [Candidatus Latescibacterota bacterium]